MVPTLPAYKRRSLAFIGAAAKRVNVQHEDRLSLLLSASGVPPSGGGRDRGTKEGQNICGGGDRSVAYPDSACHAFSYHIYTALDLLASGETRSEATDANGGQKTWAKEGLEKAWGKSTTLP